MVVLQQTRPISKLVGTQKFLYETVLRIHSQAGTALSKMKQAF